MVTFRKVQQSIKYIKYSTAKPGDVLAEGVFVSTELVDNFHKTAKEPQHRILAEDGSIVALKSAGQLNFLMSRVQQGTLIRVTFLGKELVKIKGTSVSANQFEVEVAEDVDSEEVA